MNRYRDDDDGQVDGDFAGPSPFGQPPSPFAAAPGQQPWLRTAEPPWHLWGNTQRIELTLPAGQTFSDTVRGQLTKVGYGRPDTWHWLFTARMIEGDDADPGEPLQLQVTWEIVVGMGRSIQQNLAFDGWNFLWGAPRPDAFPRRLFWATETYQDNLNRTLFSLAPATEPFNKVTEIVAQDIQLNVRCTLIRGVLPGTAKRAVLEVGAQWAPKSHVRPDWFQLDVPPEAQFPGSEIKGR